MPYTPMTRDEHFANNGRPKRILALDGGGLRGILTLGILKKIEALLRTRHAAGPEFRLCHYFDLIAGTSTGAIIAAALALESSVEEIYKKYLSLGKRVFERDLLRIGLLRAKYDKNQLEEELQELLGNQTLLGGRELHTGLLVVTKRLDTGSPWPISNNPSGKYFASRPGSGTIGNGEYLLWQVVRASAAAPVFFDPESITIAEKPGHKPVTGDFVDGGVSPFNNPALQAFMYATIQGYNLCWPTGADNILLVSVGTGAPDPNAKTSGIAAQHAIKSLLSLMVDCSNLQEVLLQWMSSSPTAKVIDRELGELRDDLIAGKPLLTYLRYNVELSEKNVKLLDPKLTDPKLIKSLSEIDAPENMELLHHLGLLAGQRDVQSDHFPTVFDLSDK